MEKFKTDLVAHTESIEMLLMAIQTGVARIESKKNAESQRKLAGRLQRSYMACIRKLSVIMGSVTVGIEHRGRLLEVLESIMKTNFQIFRIILDAQNIIEKIPGQVDNQ